MRYPDLTIVCGPVEDEADRVAPTVVFEILSPSTTLTDLRVKPLDYAALPSVLVYVTLEQDEPRAVVRRREGDWAEESCEGLGGALPLSELYGA